MPSFLTYDITAIFLFAKQYSVIPFLLAMLAGLCVCTRTQRANPHIVVCSDCSTIANNGVKGIFLGNPIHIGDYFINIHS